MASPPSPFTFFKLYQDRQFLNTFARYYRMSIVDLDGLLAAERRYPGIGAMQTMLYGPEMFGPPHRWLGSLRRLTGSSVKIMTNYACPDLTEYQTAPEGTCTYFVDLTEGEHAVWRRMKKKSREVVRKSGRLGCSVRESKRPADINTFHEILTRTSQHGQNFEVPGRHFFDLFLNTPYGRLFIIELNDEIAGGAFVTVSDVIHGLYAGIRPDLRTHVSTNFLYWHIIKYGMEHDLFALDFGIHAPGESPNLVKFKLSMASQTLPAYIYDVPLSRPKYQLGRLMKRIAVSFP